MRFIAAVLAALVLTLEGWGGIAQAETPKIGAEGRSIVGCLDISSARKLVALVAKGDVPEIEKFLEPGDKCVKAPVPVGFKVVKIVERIGGFLIVEVQTLRGQKAYVVFKAD